MNALKIKKKSDASHQHPAAEPLKEIVGAEEMVRLNLQVPESLRRNLKARAASEGKSIQDIVTGLLVEYLN
jgi:predicted HicB family RNase H-like nuclease